MVAVHMHHTLSQAPQIEIANRRTAHNNPPKIPRGQVGNQWLVPLREVGPRRIALLRAWETGQAGPDGDMFGLAAIGSTRVEQIG